MKYTDISKAFTDKVSEFLSKGFIFNVSSMGGSQGEIACVHVTDGESIYAICIRNFSEYTSDEPYVYEGIELVVGKCTDKVGINRVGGWDTVWLNHLDIIEQERFYQPCYYGRRDFYATKEEYERIKGIQRMRRNRMYDTDTDRIYLPEKAKAIVVSWVQRQPKCKTVKVSDIKSVCRTMCRDRLAYEVVARNHRFTIASV